MEEFNNKLGRKILSRVNILILLSLSIIGLLYLLQKNNFHEMSPNSTTSNIDFSKSYEDLNKNIASLEKLLEEKQNIVNENTKPPVIASNSNNFNPNIENLYLYNRLLSNAYNAKNLFFMGSSYIEHLTQFETLVKDEKVKNIINDMKNYVDNNISIITLLETLDKINSSTETYENISEPQKLTNNVTSYITNIIKIKELSNSKLDEDLIKNIRKHIINRDLELALKDIENLKTINSNTEILKEKLRILSSINSLFSELLTYLSSENFVESNFHTP